ncbi:MAG: GNAT family N-acetyltransferase [Gammaproteobacteria bacterium]
MTALGKVARAADVYRREGWAGVGRRLRRLWNGLWGYRTYALYVIPIRSEVALWPRRLDDLIRKLRQRYEIEWSDAGLAGKLTEYTSRRADVAPCDAGKWIESGHRTIMISDKGKVVGDCWLALDAFPLPARSPALAGWLEESGYAYSYMAFVEPRYRGLGVFPLLLAEQIEYARRHGRRGLMGAVLPRSKSSAASLETMGFVLRGRLHIFRILGREFTRLNIENSPEAVNSDD